MRGVAAACWVAIALLGSARAEEPATTSTTAAPTASAAPAASAPVVQETTVRGTPPDLAGRWVASQRHDADPSGAPLIRQAMVYAALAATDGDYTGNYDGVSLAAAPFPIPITFKGTFRLYRLTGEPKPRGLLARLLDALAGCGARTQ